MKLLLHVATVTFFPRSNDANIMLAIYHHARSHLCQQGEEQVHSSSILE
jgi:hypothetical protein